MSTDPAHELAEVRAKIALTEAKINAVENTLPVDVPRRNRLEEYLLELQKKETLLLKAFVDAGAGGGMEPTRSNISDLMLEKLELIAEQTKPHKVKKPEQASHLHSDVRKYFFQCREVPLISILPKRFDSTINAEALLHRVIDYANVMRTRYLANQVKEVEFVQPEIQDVFWPNTKHFLRYHEHCTMVQERPYEFKVENEDIEATIAGKTDHVIRVISSAFSSLTIEDKFNCCELTDKEISQAVTQVDFEVQQLEQFLNYAPKEYVGLLQNGPVWMAILRRIESGKVLWTYTAASPAFEINKATKKPSEVNPVSCIEIARLIEHAYCTADQITEGILYPERRPMSALYTITEHHLDERDEDEDESDQGADSSAIQEGGEVAAAVAASTVAPTKSTSKQQQRQQNKGRKFSSSSSKEKADAVGGKAGKTAMDNDDYYFILPLTMHNVARRASSVY